MDPTRPSLETRNAQENEKRVKRVSGVVAFSNPANADESVPCGQRGPQPVAAHLGAPSPRPMRLSAQQPPRLSARRETGQAAREDELSEELSSLSDETSGNVPFVARRRFRSAADCGGMSTGKHTLHFASMSAESGMLVP